MKTIIYIWNIVLITTHTILNSKIMWGYRLELVVDNITFTRPHCLNYISLWPLLFCMVNEIELFSQKR